MPADAEEHARHDAERHDDEADAKERIEARDERVDRQQRRKEVVEQHAGQHIGDRDAREVREQSRGARHEHRTDKHEEHDGEHAHDEEHRAPHVVADDLRDALAILAQRDHAREIVVHAAGEDRAEDDPEIDARPPDRTAERAEDWAEAGDVEELDHEDLPGRQRDVVDAVVMAERRRRTIRRPEDVLDDLAVDEIPNDECTERKKKCCHISFTSCFFVV